MPTVFQNYLQAVAQHINFFITVFSSAKVIIPWQHIAWLTCFHFSTVETHTKAEKKTNTRYTMTRHTAHGVFVAHYLLHTIMKVQQNNGFFLSLLSRSRKFLGCFTASASVLQPWDLFITVILIYRNSPKQNKNPTTISPYDIHTSPYQIQR